MQDKFNLQNFYEHIHLFILATVFGVASFLFKVREGKAVFTGFNAFSEISFSLISAYIAFRLCNYFNAPEDLLWVFTGIAAWSGTRFLIKMENVLDSYVNDKFHIKEEPKEDKSLTEEN